MNTFVNMVSMLFDVNPSSPKLLIDFRSHKYSCSTRCWNTFKREIHCKTLGATRLNHFASKNERKESYHCLCISNVQLAIVVTFTF